ncbi:MAG: hypothetical protein JNK79_05215 [Chitinophagaceae bacterium]|nr:hypothetical protein [Chitinophagaceae bacterium]
MITNATLVEPKASSRKQIIISLYAAIVTFLAYTSVYAFRKPFTVATFDGLEYWRIPYQSLLIIAQGIGYMLSKFYGIKFIAELSRLARWKTMAILIGISWFALFGFALAPAPYGIIFLLLNGFPLGFLWGIIFSYVEGRRATDIIGSALAVSFIFAGGFTRSVAKWLMVEWSVQENWMPFLTGLLFCLPLAILIFLMEKIPAPDSADVFERTGREPMNRDARKKFLKAFSVGVFAITLTYVFLTLMRDIRDNFMANIWNELGYGSDYSIFTTTETRTSVIVLVMMSFLVLIRRNIQALRLTHVIIAFGLVVAGSSSALFAAGYMDGATWMQLVSLGLYLAYIPFNCIFFERLIAAFKIKGNVGFLIYFADAFGYLGSTVVMCSKALFDIKLNWSHLYSQLTIVASMVGFTAIICSFVYHNKKYRLQKEVPYA